MLADNAANKTKQELKLAVVEGISLEIMKDRLY